jgi:hypothetical protein
LRQIFIPLMSIVSDDSVREELRDVLWRYHQELRADRSMEVEAQTLDVIRVLLAGSSRPSVSIKEVTDRFAHRHGRDYERITPKWIGTIIRKRLHLRTHKSGHGVFVISPEELKKLPTLYEKYGVMPVGANGATLPVSGDEPGIQAKNRDLHDPADDEGKTEVVDVVDVSAADPAGQTIDERRWHAVFSVPPNVNKAHIV